MYAEHNEGNMAYAMKSYVWKLLQVNLGWKSSDYQGAIPIIPNAQQPEFVRMGKPFLTYGSADQPVGHLYVHRTASLAYNIYSTKPDEVVKTVNLLTETLSRQDDSAKDINEWLDKEAAGRNVDRNVWITSTRTMMSETPEPTDAEGGLVAGYVLLTVQYIMDDTDIQTAGFTYP